MERDSVKHENHPPRSTVTESEKSTEAFDSESMRYLSYVLYPLCIGGAVYSLVYVPHKSWWSWTIQSVVNGVYAFGFLFMLPQLFVIYKVSKWITIEIWMHSQCISVRLVCKYMYHEITMIEQRQSRRFAYDRPRL